ncbi:hypothetical protein B0T26DRAFT_709867 [Lasiosphaeria miniovina]|uniref:DUF1993 domain-containing protein n=1 Tax=Lasiosphaeria miniovina TaxID=1954250 RepID=A0AA40AKF8_9PEZI|nr:uncharacterized protein B0T26DRAFT_709867 [Lasiosphaeria miniovina]KAK0717417.1 hypothetical protein B0T26DRAFT_709867 [Lasiosphaeria miniovina]
MTSLYKQSVPVFVKYLRGLSGLLEKGEKFANEKGMKHDEMLNFRLVPDMRGIPFQVQSCSNTAKFAAVRVGGLADVTLEDNETTFAELQARIARTIEILESADPHSMDGMEDKEVIMETKMGNFRFTGQRYVSEYAIPNFHFHLTSAYCILRHLGVPVGAFDYLKDVFEKV